MTTWFGGASATDWLYHVAWLALQLASYNIGQICDWLVIWLGDYVFGELWG